MRLARTKTLNSCPWVRGFFALSRRFFGMRMVMAAISPSIRYFYISAGLAFFLINSG